MSGLEKVLHFFLMLFLSIIALGGIVVILYSIKQLIRETLEDRKEYEELRKFNERYEKLRKKLEEDNKNMNNHV